MMKFLVWIYFLVCSFSVWSQDSVRPWIGIQIQGSEKGVLIEQAIPGTPGFRAGLKAGDIVMEIDKVKIKETRELIQTTINKGVGNEVTLKVPSQGKTKEVKLKLEAKPGITKLVERRLLNKKAPDFTAKVLSGGKEKTFNLYKDKAKVLILEFWATWCGACLQAHPMVAEFAKKSKDIKVLAISHEEGRKVRKYLAQAKAKKVTNESVIFIQGEEVDLHEKFFVPALPMFLVLDENKIVKQVSIGVGENLLKTFKYAKSLL